MPNGGPDCCAQCVYNKAVQEVGSPSIKENQKKFFEVCYCLLRDVKINIPFWTYCKNFRYGIVNRQIYPDVTPIGWIYSQGLYEGYVRIPWDDKNEPEVEVTIVCTICGRRKKKEGIKINHSGEQLGFCSNNHYVKWWKTIHADDSIKAEEFELPL